MLKKSVTNIASLIFLIMVFAIFSYALFVYFTFPSVITDNFDYEKRKLISKMYDSKYKLLKKVDKLKSNSEKILIKLNS